MPGERTRNEKTKSLPGRRLMLPRVRLTAMKGFLGSLWRGVR
jgi:hypothetical protein